MSSIAIVHGSKEQQPGTWPARELYTGQLFEKKRQYADRWCDKWVIISERYGLVEPDDPITYYDQVFTEMDEAERNQWVSRMKQALSEQLFDIQNVPRYNLVTVLTSQEYLDLFASVFRTLDQKGTTVNTPLKHKRIGEQIQWLTREANMSS